MMQECLQAAEDEGSLIPLSLDTQTGVACVSPSLISFAPRIPTTQLPEPPLLLSSPVNNGLHQLMTCSISKDHEREAG